MLVVMIKTKLVYVCTWFLMFIKTYLARNKIQNYDVVVTLRHFCFKLNSVEKYSTGIRISLRTMKMLTF